MRKLSASQIHALGALIIYRAGDVRRDCLNSHTVESLRRLGFVDGVNNSISLYATDAGRAWYYEHAVMNREASG